jgi:hypothetical protein
MGEVVDLIVGGEETLCLARRLEALHLALSSARRLVRILGSVVQALMLAMLLQQMLRALLRKRRGGATLRRAEFL